MEGQLDQELRRQVKTFPLMCLAFIAIIVLMFILLWPSIESDKSSTTLEPLAIIGIAFLAAGAGHAAFRLGRRKVGTDLSELLPPGRFQTEMLISLVLIEAYALLGIFAVRSEAMSLAMPVAAVVVITVGVLPHALNYVKVVQKLS